MWFRSEPILECYYCSSTLTLLSPISPSDVKGKQKQVEGNIAVGTKQDYECCVCGCRNTRDKNGRILSNRVSDDPGSSRDSFTLTGTATRNSSPSPFCRQCLSNQSLQIHLLSSYPSSSSDEDEPYSSTEPSEPFPPLSDYKQSLDRRYPLLCAECAPAVEEIVRNRDYRVKTAILGGRLRETTKFETSGMGETSEERRKWLIEGAIWRIRGLLWAYSHVVSLLFALQGLLGMPAFDEIAKIPYLPNPLSLLVILFAPLWTFWDPRWNMIRTETRQRRRRKFTVKYRKLYIILQGNAYLDRIVTSLVLRLDLFDLSPAILYGSLLLVTLIALLSPLRIPQLHYPPPILLKPAIDSPLRPSTPTSPNELFPDSLDEIDPLEPLQHLSLSKRTILLSSSSGTSTPTRSSSNLKSRVSTLRNKRTEGGATQDAKFGESPWSSPQQGVRQIPPSFPDNLHSDPSPEAMELESDSHETQENSMDWSPLSPPLPPRSEPIQFARQRFVPPDFKVPTGLEGILERIGLRGDTDGAEMEVDEREDGNARAEGEDSGWWRRWIGG
ncbi:hypothetical protein JCM5353_001207 [Sporobolomyces roseus]